jgi:hypothetical protein
MEDIATLKANAHGDFAQLMLRTSYVREVRRQDVDKGRDEYREA